MSLADIDDRTWEKIVRMVRWFDQNYSRLLSLVGRGADGKFQPVYGIRGMLLQDVYGNGSGLLQTLIRTDLPTSFMLSIIGNNPPKQADFNLKLVGTKDDGNSDTIFNVDIPLVDQHGVILTTDQMIAAMVAGSVRSAFPLGTSDIQIDIGNPFSSAFLVGYDPDHPQPSWPGRYIITFTEALMQVYDLLTFTVENPTIIGLSTIVVQNFTESASDEQELVYDTYNKPVDNPWQAGSIVTAIPMIDLGFAIIGSDYRDVTYVPTTVSP